MNYHPRNDPGAQQSSENESGPSSGFRSFWKKSDDATSQRNVTFVQQDPTGKKKISRITRLFRQASSPSASESAQSEESGKSTAQKRRQQVYQAQKRHRNRKAEYVKNLEDEIARLQHLDALINHEKTALAHQNEAMRAYLASQSIDIRLESLNLGTSSNSNDSLSALGGAALDIRYDPDVGHERVFMDFADDENDDRDDDMARPEMSWASEFPAVGEAQRPARRRYAPVKGDSWAALDFILALEWPCKDHVHHPGIHPDPERPPVPDEFTGHALTKTAAVYQSALPPANLIHDIRPAALDTRVPVPAPAHAHAHAPSCPPFGPGDEMSRRWHLPHSEIDKYGPPAAPGPPLYCRDGSPCWTSAKQFSDRDSRLVSLSESLELDDEQMTPAQAYSAIREAVEADELLRPTLDAIKVPLGGLVHCTGIGAVLPADLFWQQLDIALQTVKAGGRADGVA